MQSLVIITTAASLAAMSAAQRFSALVTAVQSAQSADIVLGKILSSIEDTRTDGTLAKYVEKETGITSREIGHAYKSCVIFRALVKPGLNAPEAVPGTVPEAVYDAALPSWMVPACAIVNAFDDAPGLAEKKAETMAKLATLFTEGKKGDDTTKKLVELKESLLGTPEKKPTKAEKEKAELTEKLTAAEAKVKEAEENGKKHQAEMEKAAENGRIMMEQLQQLQQHGERLVFLVRAVAEVTKIGIQGAPETVLENMEPNIEALPDCQTKAELVACFEARRTEVRKVVQIADAPKAAKAGKARKAA